MYYSIVEYPNTTGGRIYNVPFRFINREHVSVLVDGLATSAFTWLDDGRIQLNVAPASGAKVTIKRTTPLDNPIVDFTNGSVLTDADLDVAAIQSLYVSQEVLDAYGSVVYTLSQLSALSGNVPPPASPGDDGKLLVAMNGIYSWVGTIALPTGTIAALTSTTITTGGFQATTGVVTTLDAEAITGSTLSLDGGSLTLVTPWSTAGSLKFKRTPGIEDVAAQFTLGHTADDNQLHLQAFDGSHTVDFITYRKGVPYTTSEVTLHQHLKPAITLTTDIGDSTHQMRNVYASDFYAVNLRSTGRRFTRRCGCSITANAVAFASVNATWTGALTFGASPTIEDSESGTASPSWTAADPTKVYIRETGVYAITASVAFQQAAAGVRLMRVLQNATIIARSYVSTGHTADTTNTLNVSTFASLTAGDYITINAYQGAGGGTVDVTPSLRMYRIDS